jgi:hypothetical protein
MGAAGLPACWEQARPAVRTQSWGDCMGTSGERLKLRPEINTFQYRTVFFSGQPKRQPHGSQLGPQGLSRDVSLGPRSPRLLSRPMPGKETQLTPRISQTVWSLCAVSTNGIVSFSTARLLTIYAVQSAGTSHAARDLGAESGNTLSLFALCTGDKYVQYLQYGVHVSVQFVDCAARKWTLENRTWATGSAKFQRLDDLTRVSATKPDLDGSPRPGAVHSSE